MTAQKRGKRSARVDLARLLPPFDTTSQAWRDLAQIVEDRGGQPVDPETHTVLATRHMARKIAALLPDGPVVLDCSDVFVMSPPFIDELLTLRPGVEPENMDEDVAISWQLVVERRAE